MEYQKKKKRLHCKFNTCKCQLYCGKQDDRCESCGHGDVWHELTYVTKKKSNKKEKNIYDDMPS